MATAYLHKSISNAGNQKKWTWSAWLKKSEFTGTDNGVFGFYENDQNYFRMRFRSDQQFQVDNYYSNSSTMNLIPNRHFNDVSGFYHMVVTYDSAQATASNRVKIYVNGDQITSFSSETYPSQNTNTRLGNSGGSNIELGRTTNSQYFNGIFAHVHYCDGYAYAPTDFAETDTTTGTWKPKVSPSVSYGTNGFFFKFDNSGNMGLDSSGQSNNYTTSGTLIQNKDTPNNVFCTWNAGQSRPFDVVTFSNGNNTVTRSGSNWTHASGTLAVSAGKYYWELKPTGTVTNNCFAGICSEAFQTSDVYRDSTPYNDTTGVILYFQDGRKTVNGTDTNSFFSSYAANDIIGVLLDLDSATKTVTFYKNGSISGSAVNLPTNMQTGFIHPVVMFNGSSNVMAWNANFGNGYFGTTAVTSAQNPDDGNGIFEYDVPANYRAICTKSINAEEYS